MAADRGAGAVLDLVPPPATPDPPLDGLLAVAAALRTGGPDLQPTLDALATSVADLLQVATVAINVYRPAFHDSSVRTDAVACRG